MDCPYCGQRIQPGNYFCRVCGVYRPTQDRAIFSEESVRLALNGVRYRHLSLRQKIAVVLTGLEPVKLYAIYFTTNRLVAIKTDRSMTQGSISTTCSPLLELPYDLPLQRMIVENEGSFEIAYDNIRTILTQGSFPWVIHEDIKRLEFMTKEQESYLFGVSSLQLRVFKEATLLIRPLALKVSPE